MTLSKVTFSLYPGKSYLAMIKIFCMHLAIQMQKIAILTVCVYFKLAIFVKPPITKMSVKVEFSLFCRMRRTK